MDGERTLDMTYGLRGGDSIPNITRKGIPPFGSDQGVTKQIVTCCYRTVRPWLATAHKSLERILFSFRAWENSLAHRAHRK